MIDATVDLKESKSLLPAQLIFPLPEDSVDALIFTQELAVHCCEDKDADETDRDYALLAALIELKELRAKKDNVLDDQAREDLYQLYDNMSDYEGADFWAILECVGCEEEFEKYMEDREC